jgi:hypothetical protein
MYLVHAIAPRGGIKGWDFRGDFFPRKVYYKKDALALAQEAKAKGGSGVKVEKVK